MGKGDVLLVIYIVCKWVYYGIPSKCSLFLICKVSCYKSKPNYNCCMYHKGCNWNTQTLGPPFFWVYLAPTHACTLTQAMRLIIFSSYSEYPLKLTSAWSWSQRPHLHGSSSDPHYSEVEQQSLLLSPPLPGRNLPPPRGRCIWC